MTNILLDNCFSGQKENDDEFAEWDEEQENEDKSKYWFTRDKMDKIIKVHDYLDSLPEMGKVLSFASILRVAEDLNKKELQSLEIAVLYSKIPDEIKKEIINKQVEACGKSDEFTSDMLVALVSGRKITPKMEDAINNIIKFIMIFISIIN